MYTLEPNFTFPEFLQENCDPLLKILDLPLYPKANSYIDQSRNSAMKEFLKYANFYLKNKKRCLMLVSKTLIDVC